ncbi:MAG: alpha-keto acid decarboxylase family protein [Armatimonadota bacterium]
MNSGTTIATYLIQQLANHGVGHVFGIPGDYSLAFLEELLKSPVEFINTCDEQGAGFAADGYARFGGLGAVCVTYAVGSLKVANATAQAFAERSPLVVICGAPGVQERNQHPLLHHLVNQYDTQLKVFRQLTVATAVLDNPETAYAEIDRVLHAAMRHMRPVYIELPRDMVHMPGRQGHTHHDEPERSHEGALAEAVQEAREMLAAARQPVIIAGVELKRFGMHEELIRFADQMQIPICVTMQGKSVVREDHPLYLGLYAGAIGSEATRQYVESSDCQLLLGTMLTDINLGMFTARLDRAYMIVANTDGVSIRHHAYDARMGHFLAELMLQALPVKAPDALPCPAALEPFIAESDRPVTVKRLSQRLNACINEHTIVLADIGDSLFGALGMQVYNEGRFICTAYYSNMGFALPGAIGVQMRNRQLRPLVLVGDGAFQMTGMELSTIARYGLNPIVVVLNNQGYATERFFLDGTFNEIHPWNYSRIPDVLGAGQGFSVYTEDELECALAAAERNTESYSILDVHVARGDVSEVLTKLGESFGKTVHG